MKYLKKYENVNIINDDEWDFEEIEYSNVLYNGHLKLIMKELGVEYEDYEVTEMISKSTIKVIDGTIIVTYQNGVVDKWDIISPNEIKYQW